VCGCACHALAQYPREVPFLVMRIHVVCALLAPLLPAGEQGRLHVRTRPDREGGQLPRRGACAFFALLCFAMWRCARWLPSSHFSQVPRTLVSPPQILETMRRGYANRQTFATNMNLHSSRSHWCVCARQGGLRSCPCACIAVRKGRGGGGTPPSPTPRTAAHACTQQSTHVRVVPP
jgi:hypothetical protein